MRHGWCTFSAMFASVWPGNLPFAGVDGSAVPAPTLTRQTPFNANSESLPE